MKSVIIAVAALFACTATASAQKYALMDMEYILKNIPAYERANEQLEQVSKKWEAEVEALNTEAQTMYKNYQNEVGVLFLGLFVWLAVCRFLVGGGADSRLSLTAAHSAENRLSDHRKQQNKYSIQ